MIVAAGPLRKLLGQVPYHPSRMMFTACEANATIRSLKTFREGKDSMRNLPINWTEGLFLRPQHFQAADRHWNEFVHTSEQWDHPYNYGLHSFEYSREALANHQLEINEIKARMRDGTLVSLVGGQGLDRLDFKEALEKLHKQEGDVDEAFTAESKLRVFLAVPKLQIGRANVGRPGEADQARYLESEQSTQEESRGGDDQPLQFKALNVKLMLSTDDHAGYEVLPIAQIDRAGDERAVPQLDENYIPPVLAIDTWPGLGGEIVRAIYDIVGRKAEVLSQQLVNRGTGLDSRHPGDLDRVLMLSELNAAHSSLGVLAFARGVHPLTAYTELCRLVGQLSIFSDERKSTGVPSYDHDDLAGIFRPLRQRIEQLIYSVRDYEFQQRYFIGVGLGMQASLEPQWFNSDWQWYIGVNKGDLTLEECRDLLSPGQLDWKFGSSRQVEILFSQRAEGLQLIPVDRSIRSLPASQDWIYYEVPRRDAPAWRDVQQTQTLAVRLRDSLIVNRDRLQGERTLVVSFRGKKASLQFALFAVPVQT